MFKAYYGYEDLVSILAPLARGALQGTAWNREIAIIVSILAPLARGALRQGTRRHIVEVDVSILAPLARGALLSRRR